MFSLFDFKRFFKILLISLLLVGCSSKRLVTQTCTIKEAENIASAKFNIRRNSDFQIRSEEDKLFYYLHFDLKGNSFSQNGEKVTLKRGGGAIYTIEKKTCKILKTVEYQ